MSNIGPSSVQANSAQSLLQAQFRERVLARVREKQAQDVAQKTQLSLPDFSHLEALGQAESPSLALSKLPELSAMEAAKPLLNREDVERQQLETLTIQRPTQPNILQKSSVETTTNRIPNESSDWIADIQRIAKESGIIDLRAQDILHAQYTGSSLLADYSV